MSCFERAWGEGKVTKASIKELKAKLIDAYKYDYEKRVTKAGKKQFDKPSSRLTSFPMIISEDYAEGSVTLNMTEGTFSFGTTENNHTVDECGNTRVFQVLRQFMRSIPETGKTYGAVEYYTSEYQDDKSEHTYGSWIPAWAKRRRRA